uniref:Uncharacterized protein n=1 Tax=Arundo donax TaxID=35708 RepID=A0A0A9GPK2_ARUDO
MHEREFFPQCKARRNSFHTVRSSGRKDIDSWSFNMSIVNTD